MADKDIFYLEKAFPEADKLFSSNYPPIDEIEKDCIFILDTNILFVPFDTSEKSLSFIEQTFKDLKQQNRLYVPARVAREFAKNRGKTIGNVFLKIRQKKNSLNAGTFKIDDYPLLEHNEDFAQLQQKFKSIRDLISESRELFLKIEDHILTWNWNDPVSSVYTEVFTPEIIVEMKKSREDLEKDLKFRIEHKIPPGFKDSGKIDDGVGDLIVWQTVMEIAKEKKKNVILVSNDQKNDWFYIQDKTGLYPRFELFDEFRRFTEGNSIAIIDFPNLLKMFNASEDIVDEVEDSIQELQGQKKLVSEALWLKREIDVELGRIVQNQLSEEEKENFKIQSLTFGQKLALLRSSDLFSLPFFNELRHFRHLTNLVAHENAICTPSIILKGKDILERLKEQP